MLKYNNLEEVKQASMQFAFLQLDKALWCIPGADACQRMENMDHLDKMFSTYGMRYRHMQGIDNLNARFGIQYRVELPLDLLERVGAQME
jgi:hypothetical protein